MTRSRRPYAAQFSGTEPEAPLDLAMVDTFVPAMTEDGGSDDPPRVLDAGCGTGRMSRYLADRGCMVE